MKQKVEYQRRKVGEIATAIHDLSGGLAGKAFDPEVETLVRQAVLLLDKAYTIAITPK